MVEIMTNILGCTNIVPTNATYWTLLSVNRWRWIHNTRYRKPFLAMGWYDMEWENVGQIKGDEGKGISSITLHYLATSASSGVTIGTSGWTTTIQTMTPEFL